MTDPKHSPTPALPLSIRPPRFPDQDEFFAVVTADGSVIARCTHIKDAAHIVRCVNATPAAIEALRWVIDFGDIGHEFDCPQDDTCDCVGAALVETAFKAWESDAT